MAAAGDGLDVVWVLSAERQPVLLHGLDLWTFYGGSQTLPIGTGAWRHGTNPAILSLPLAKQLQRALLLVNSSSSVAVCIAFGW